MTAYTVLSPSGADEAMRLLQTVTIANQTANSAAVSRAVPVPQWATSVTFLLDVTVMGGTTPLLDFVVKGVNPFNIDDAHTWPLGDWDGITQLTTAGSTPVIAIEIGPGVSTDDTGSATADCRYGVNALLPP